MQVMSSVEDAFVVRRRALRQAQGKRRLMLLLAAVGVVVAVAGYWGLRMSSAFDVTRVQVVGTSGPLGAQVEAAVASQTQGKSLLGMDAGSMQMIHVQSPQNGGQLGMIGPLPAQLTGTFIGPSDLQRCEALGGGERRSQCHLHVEFEMVTLVSGRQVG